MKKRTIKFSLLLAITIGLFNTACSNDEWDKHYNNTNVVLISQSLSEIIDNEADLTIFNRLMEISGYDMVLTSPQTFTVWAPLDTDSAWRADYLAFTVEGAVISAADSSKIAKVIGNHISRFSYPTSGLDSQRLLLLCKKIADFKMINSDAYFGKIPLSFDSDIPAKNGILHKIIGYSPYIPSHWEYFMSYPEGMGLDSLKAYFNSLIITDDYGDISNTVFNDYAKLDDDDSTYTFIALNDNAWTKALNNSLPYHKVWDVQNMQLDPKMQLFYSKAAVISDLFFSKVADPAGRDSIVSTSKTIFHDVDKLFVGATKINSSNGSMFITDSLRMKAQESWHKTIVVEAERNTYGRTNATSDLFTRSYDGSAFPISEGKYLYLKSTSSTNSSKASATFNIPNVLSASYNLYVVFVPEAIENPTSPLPIKAEIRVYFRSVTGAVPPIAATTGVRVPIASISGTTVQKVFIRKFTFPWCSMYVKGNPNSLDVKVLVENTATTNDLSARRFKRDLRIDCVILEPVE